MQYNNKNESIANKLEIISDQIVNEDKNNTTKVLATIQQAYEKIEEIAQANEVPILRAIAHWMALNFETNSENEQKITSLLENESYSNWINQLASILHKHEAKLLPAIHHSLTSPDWVVKPSAPLLTGLASWLSIVKIEHENNLRIEAELEEKQKSESVIKSSDLTPETLSSEIDNETESPSEFTDDLIDDLIDDNEILNISSNFNKNDDDISRQITKAKEANEKTLIHSTVFEELDLDLLEKGYLPNELLNESFEESSNTEDFETTRLESEKSSLDDEKFEVSNLIDSMISDEDMDLDLDLDLDTILDDKTLNNSSDKNSIIDNGLIDQNSTLINLFTNSDEQLDSVNNENDSNDKRQTSENEHSSSSSFESQLSNIHQKLMGVHIPSKDIFSVNDKFLKQLDALILLTNDSSLNAITPVAEWSKRNIKLFENNETSKINTFVKTGTVWTWIEQIHSCLTSTVSESGTCLSDLTNTLTHEEWVEPIDTDELEALLISMKSVIDGDHDIQISSNDEAIEKTKEGNLIDANINDDLTSNSKETAIDYPELLDASQHVDTTSKPEDNLETESTEIETNGFQMTWDDNTHPELLMVYLEETPTQIEELLPLLNSISDNQADEKQKLTAARLAHTIKGGSAVVGITALSEFSYRLETLLDYSKNHKVDDNILALLPSAGNCLESLFDSVQLQTAAPSEFKTIFNTLDTYVSSIDMEADEIELTTPELPDFILKQNSDLTDNIFKDLDVNHSNSNAMDLLESEENSNELFEIDIIDNEEVESDLLENSLEKVDLIEHDLLNEDISDVSLDDMIDDLIEDSHEDSIEKSLENIIDEKIDNSIIENTEKDIENNFKKSSENDVSDLLQVGLIQDDQVKNVVIRNTVEDSIHVELTEETEEPFSTSETSGFQLNWDDDTHPELLMVYLEETPTQINELVPLLNKISESSADADEKQVASRMAHTIKGASAIVGITALSEISYRLETLLDHSVKHQLPADILALLPATASCIEKLFDAVQMQDQEPTEYFTIFKQLDKYVSNIDESDELLELIAPVLPDFIINQNNNSDENTEHDQTANEIEEATNETEVDEPLLTDDIVSKERVNDVSITEDSLAEVSVTENSIAEGSLTEDPIVPDSIAESSSTELLTDIEPSMIEEESSKDLEAESNEVAQLEKLAGPEDVKNIIEEIDDIVMSLVTVSSKSKSIKTDLNHYLTELHRFDLIADISGYPELSLLSQWCQSNLDLFAEKDNEANNAFIISGEIWLWIEYVGTSLNEPDDMSHMSSLSAELMRDDWAQAIEMHDLQTVLLALRNIEKTDGASDEEFTTGKVESDDIISWDKDVHPELLAVYFNETPDQINQVSELLHIISKGESTTEQNKKASRIAHTIKGASGVVGLDSLVDLTHSLEDILDYSVNNKIPSETAELLAEASDCLEELFESIQNKQAAPDDLPSVLERLSKFSSTLDHESSAASMLLDLEENEADYEYTPVVGTINTVSTESTSEQKRIAKIDINESYIRVPVKVIDKLINLAGELVTTSSLVSDNLANTLITNKAIRSQDERVHNMLSELTNTIVQQEKDQHNLLSSLEHSDFDSLEMDTYNELHSVASLLSESILDSQEIDLTLNTQLSDLSDKLRSLDKLNKDISDVILSSRMVSINTIIPRLERIVRQTCRKTDKKAELVVTGNNIYIDTDILNGLVDPLLHMLRNSIDHGIETQEVRAEKNKDVTGLIELSFVRDGNNILMSLKDDGAGIDPEVIYQKAIHKDLITPDQEFSVSDTLKLILEPGFTTQENVTDISGRGVGMDVVNSSVQDLNGTLTINSEINEGTTFNLTIPVTLITNTTLLVKTANNIVAIPTDSIDQILYQERNTVIAHDDAFFVMYEDQEIEIKSLAKLLSWGNQEIDFKKSYNVLIITIEEQVHAIHIDSIISSREVVVKPLSPWISTAKGVIGACHLNDGGVAPVIHLSSVVEQASVVNSSLTVSEKVQSNISTKPTTTPKILVVDDSLSNRKALSLIIEKTKYEVITAVDGMDALKLMNENTIDLVFTDLEMPRMNGLELTQTIRAWTDKSKIPIVMITSRTTSKHRELATKAGVDDYLTKPVVTETLLESIDTWLENKSSLTA